MARLFRLTVVGPNKVGDDKIITATVLLQRDDHGISDWPVQFYLDREPKPVADSPVNTDSDGHAFLDIPISDGVHLVRAKVVRADGVEEWKAVTVTIKPDEKPESPVKPPLPQLRKVSAFLSGDVFTVVLLRTREGNPEPGPVFYSGPEPVRIEADPDGIAKVDISIGERTRAIVFFLPENREVLIKEVVPAKPKVRQDPQEAKKAEEVKKGAAEKEAGEKAKQEAEKVGREWMRQALGGPAPAVPKKEKGSWKLLGWLKRQHKKEG